MSYEAFDEYQYDSCVSRGICSINPRISALQTVLVLYLRLFAKFAIDLNIDKKTRDFILNTIAITIYNPEFNENSYFFAVENFRKELPLVMEEFLIQNQTYNMDKEREKALDLFRESVDIVQSIKYGEKAFKKALEEIPCEIRDLYNIMLVISKSLSINLLDLESFDKTHEKAFKSILSLLSKINLEEKDVDILRREISLSAEIDVELMKMLRESQEERYGIQFKNDVSFSTVPNKAVLVVGSNIRELENVLENLKDKDIDVYTHDDMMLAHTFPKFSTYIRLKGQFGQGLENCLLDFATFPGPIILTKHSLHNIENFYRGRLFTTDYTTSPKGIVKIENNDFSEVIKSAEQAKGFKTGRICETITIGYNYSEILDLLENKKTEKKYEHIFVIGIDSYSLEQRIYFEKLIKLAPSNVLIISFSYDLEKENLIYINTCFDNYSWLKILDILKSFNLPITIFIPKCERGSISQMISLSELKDIQIYLGKCTPIMLNPSLMSTLQKTFFIKEISVAKKDLEQIFKDK